MEKIEWAFLTDLHLIKRIKDKNCEKSLIELSERHSGLYFKIIKKYSKSFFANNIDLNEATSDKNLIIWNSAKNFKEDKNVKFSTWLANQVKYFCLNTLNKKSKDRLVATEDQILDSLNEKPITQKHEYLFEFTGNILSQLKDSRIRKIFSLRYSSAEKKPSWCIIAEKLQISTQTAINLHNKGISILRKKIKSEKFLDNV
jgi:RNA polymerase sigma factor (sigma-70 family)